MRIAVLGDIHLIADQDPSADLRRVRARFHVGTAAIKRTVTWLDTLGLDAVFSVGDVIDWHSEENVALATEVMSGLRCPWHMTPGNHDLQFPKAGIPADAYDLQHVDAHRDDAIARWRRHGVELGERRITIDGHDLLLVDSASSRIDARATAWLRGQECERPILLTHVPLDRPVVRSFIHAHDQYRNLEVYTQSGSPGFFAECVLGRIPAVFTGHLHFPGTLTDHGTTFHLLDASFARGDMPPAVSIVESARGGLRITTTSAPL